MRSEKVYVKIPEVDGFVENTITFTTHNGAKEVLRVDQNGDFFVKGKKIKNDIEVYKALKEFLEGNVVGFGEPRYTLKEAQEILKKIETDERVVKEFEDKVGDKLLITHFEKKEPRYSVAELDKIFDYIQDKQLDEKDSELDVHRIDNDIEYFWTDFLTALKENKSRVEAILNEA